MKMITVSRTLHAVLALSLSAIFSACGGGGGGAQSTPDGIPVVTVPANIIAEATGTSGRNISFTASASDSNGSLTPTCSPPSGSLFSLGNPPTKTGTTTTVTCTATNTVGTGSARFNVTVRDTTPPVVAASNMIVGVPLNATSTSVIYSATATDLVSGSVTLNCSPVSGSTFNLGTTTPVSCTATDAANNVSGISSFNVTVVDRCNVNPMTQTICAMAVNEWKLWTAGTDGGFLSVALPRTRANFDGECPTGGAACTSANGTWTSDAAVGNNPMSGVGGGSNYAQWAYSAPAINAFNGDVCIQGGGHVDSGDSSIYCLNLFANPGVSWSLKVPSARYISGAEPKPSGSYQPCVKPPCLSAGEASNTTVSTTTTGTNTSGSSTLTVTSGASITNGMRIYVAGGTPTGVTVSSGGATNTLTLSTPLTGTIPAGTTVKASSGYWAAPNKNGVIMPISTHAYFSNVFGANSDILYLSGLGGFDWNASNTAGAAFAYKPSNGGTNDNMLGPFYVASAVTSPFNRDTQNGYAQQLTPSSISTICMNDIDGNLYTYGYKSTSQGGLWRITNAATAPAYNYIGSDGGSPVVSGSYTNCVIFKDPVNGANRSYFAHAFNDPTHFVLWTDIGIGGTPVFNYGTYSYPFPFSTQLGGSAGFASFTYNSDLNVMAVTDGKDIWEFSITSPTVTSAFTKITATATGNVPSMPPMGYNMVGLKYFPAPYYAYVMCGYAQCRVLRRQ